MSTGDDIVTFVRARLDEDEREARAGFSGQVDTENGWGEVGTAVTPHVGVIHEDIQRAHVVKWNPARVLHGVEVKRRLIRAASSWIHDEPDGTLTLAMAQECWRKALALLASEWDTHPDFRPEWTL